MNSLLYSHVAFSNAYMNAQGVKTAAGEKREKYDFLCWFWCAYVLRAFWCYFCCVLSTVATLLRWRCVFFCFF